MNFLKLFLSIFFTFHLFIYAEAIPSHFKTLEQNGSSSIRNNTDFTQNTVSTNNDQNTTETLVKIFSPVLLLGILIIISFYAQRQYNKHLKKQMLLAIEELRHKDKLLLQQHRMAAMGEMLSMISHQWKQPLGAINSAVMGINIKIAGGKFNLSDPFEQKKFLDYLERKHNNILEYVQYLSDTTDDFRHFFNPNKNKILTPLTRPINNTLKIVQRSLEEKGIRIIHEFKADTPVMMYENEIMQVILNILKNSEDNFLEKKIRNPKITIATLLRERQCAIRICDNGGGIPAAIAKKIFEPYFSTKDEKVGTGLGLYMSKIIMEEHHNGSLGMRNKNEGVCFELIFKLPKETI